MIQITLKNLLDAAHCGALQRFFAIDKPVAVAWKNRRQPAACDEEMKLAEERRLTLCAKYGKKNDAKQAYEFDEPNQQAFASAYRDLLDQVVDTIPGDPVKVADLAKTAARLSESDLALLEPFLTD